MIHPDDYVRVNNTFYDPLYVPSESDLASPDEEYDDDYEGE